MCSITGNIFWINKKRTNNEYGSIRGQIRNKHPVLTAIASTAILTACHGAGTGVLTFVIELAFHGDPSCIKT